LVQQKKHQEEKACDKKYHDDGGDDDDDDDDYMIYLIFFPQTIQKGTKKGTHYTIQKHTWTVKIERTSSTESR
jgi:hypothetical protein